MPPKKKTDDAAAVLAKIADWPAPFAEIGRRIHDIVLENVPELRARLWYGGCGFARGSGPVLCFVRVDDGVMSFGLTEKATLARDEDATDLLIPSAWYVTELDGATEQRIATIARKAAG